MDIVLPADGRSAARYVLVGPPVQAVIGARFSRIAYAAAHVVADPLGMTDPWSRPAVDWEGTMAFRHHLWRLGFRIAEAMDTSQRGMGFDWANAQESAARSPKRKPSPAPIWPPAREPTIWRPAPPRRCQR